MSVAGYHFPLSLSSLSMAGNAHSQVQFYLLDYFKSSILISFRLLGMQNALVLDMLNARPSAVRACLKCWTKQWLRLFERLFGKSMRTGRPCKSTDKILLCVDLA